MSRPTVSTFDLDWLMTHTVPLAGERSAALECWGNLLRDLGWGKEAIDRQLERAHESWVAWRAAPIFADGGG